MGNGEVVDWIFRGVFAGLAILWGRTQTQADTAAQILRQTVEDRATRLHEVMREHAAAFDQLQDERFAARDHQIQQATERLDRAGQKSSDDATRVMDKINHMDLRLTVLEQAVTALQTQMHALANEVHMVGLKVARMGRPAG